jgi:hypothetical protein
MDLLEREPAAFGSALRTQLYDLHRPVELDRGGGGGYEMRF